MSVVGKRVRLAGLVREGTFVRARLVAASAKDAPAVDEATREPFTLELHDGTTVRVVPKPDVNVFGDDSVERGVWGDRSSHPLARPFAGRGPGPHVNVVLSGVVFAPGDRIVVAGEVLAADPVGEGGYRAQQSVVVSEVSATAISTPGAADRIPPEAAPRRAADEPRSWKRHLWIGLVITIVCVVGKAIWTSPAILVELLVLVLACVAMTRNSTDAPRFVPISGVADFLETMGFLAMGLAMIAVATSFVLAVFSLGEWPDPSWIAIACTFAAITSLVQRRAQRGSFDIARAILGAPEHAEDGKWRRIGGVVEDPTPVKVVGAPSALSRVTEGATSIVTDGAFLVRAGDVLVEVWPDEAVWSSTVRAKSVTKKIEAEGEQTSITHEELIPVGGKAVVVARMVRHETGLRAASTGPESLLLFATAAEQDPVQELASFVAAHRRAGIVQVVLVAITAAIAVALLLH